MERLAAMRTFTAAALAALLLVATCGAPSDSLQPGPSLEPPAALRPDGEWQLVQGTLDGRPFAVDDVTLVVDGSNVGGRSGCNQYVGSVTMADRRVTLGDLGGTEMACADPAMAIETAYLAALSRVASAVLPDADTMILAGPGVELRFARLAPAPVAEIVGTQWALDGLVDGDAVSAPVGDPATLVLHADGTLEGSTGCRTLAGTYQGEGGGIVVTSLEATGECGPDVAAQDALVVDVLGDSFQVELDGQLLTLTASGGAGLVYGPSGG